MTNDPIKPDDWQPSKAALDVLAERRRQIDEEGWMPGYDDGHSDGQLARAASCYAYYGSWGASDRQQMARRFPREWPWERAWWKPSDRRRDLVKAAALILAEIERLDRIPTAPANGGDHG